MKYIYSILLIVSTFLAVNSCYVHQFPKDGTPAQVDIQLYYDTDLPPFLTLDVDSMYTKSSSERDLRYILRFHRRLSDGTYARDAELVIPLLRMTLPTLITMLQCLYPRGITDCLYGVTM